MLNSYVLVPHKLSFCFAAVVDVQTNIKILLVDDNAMNLQVLKKLLNVCTARYLNHVRIVFFFLESCNMDKD